MDHLALHLLLALSGLAHATPEPQQKFPEDFYSGANTELILPTPDVSSSSFQFDPTDDFETSPVQTSSSLQSNVDSRLSHHSIMNASRPFHTARQHHEGHAGYPSRVLCAVGYAHSLFLPHSSFGSLPVALGRWGGRVLVP